MRIAIITKSFAQSNNDWSMVPLIDFVRSISHEIEIDVYALHYPFETRSYQIFGAQIHSFDLGRYPRLLRKLYLANIRKKISRNHLNRPYNLIHAIWADTPANMAAQISTDLDVPLLTTFYAGEAVWLPQIDYGGLRSPQSLTALRKVLKQSTVTTCGSRALASEIERAQGGQIHVIPFGYDDKRFSPAHTNTSLEGDTKIITAASFSAVKGLDVVLAVFRSLVAEHPFLAEGIHWHIIGPDALNRDFRDSLLKQAENLPVTLHEAKPHWEMPDFYRAGDLVLHGSWFESQCLSVIESAACGIPVAGTRVGVIPELASPEWTCVPGNPQALKEMLVGILSNRSQWKTEANRQQVWAKTNATVDVAAERFLKLYAEVSDKGSL